MYIAGLNIPITEAQVLNAASWVSTALWFHTCIPNASFRAKAHQESGPIKAMPPGKQGQVVTTVHGLGLFVPMAVVLFSYPLSGFYAPRWLGRTSLPPMGSHGLYMGLRLAGCIGTFIGIGITKSILKHLGTQWGAIGVSSPISASGGSLTLVSGSGATEDRKGGALRICEAPRV